MLSNIEINSRDPPDEAPQPFVEASLEEHILFHTVYEIVESNRIKSSGSQELCMNDV